MNLQSPTLCPGEQSAVSEVSPTVVTFGELVITFNDSGEPESRTVSPTGSFYMDIQVSCRAAVEQIREQLITAGYRSEGNPAEHEDYTEFYFLLKKKARCVFCDHLNTNFGIKHSVSSCGGCGRRTSGNTQPVYVCGNGKQIGEDTVRSNPSGLPQPIGVKIVLVK